MFEAYESIFNRRGQAYHRAMQLVPGARRSEFSAALNKSASAGAVLFATCPPVAATSPIIFRRISSFV